MKPPDSVSLRLIAALLLAIVFLASCGEEPETVTFLTFGDPAEQRAYADR